MRFLLIIFLFLAPLTIEAKRLTYYQIHKMPTSIEKDYYIWRFLKQRNTSKKEARAIIKEASRLNSKLKKAYRRKVRYRASYVKSKETPHRTKEDWGIHFKANKIFQKGLRLLKQNKPSLGAIEFDKARKMYQKQFHKDKTLFWLYLSTKNSDYIKLLRKSPQVNLYTLIAGDSVKGSYPKIISPDFSKKYTYFFNASNPIDWAKLKYKIFDGNHNLSRLANNYKSKECLGVYCYIKEQEADYKKNYFPMPYRDIMKKLPKKRQALIYAIARQESRFVPSSVSTSFALGMMQFMPFLIEHVAKKKHQKIDLNDIFKPKKAIEYANFHLNYLEKYLYHPLFIAYAYNGGIGFTKRHIKKPYNFRKGAYEPYMSMETMENVEAREYGKKVLANYVIYLNKLGIRTRIFPLLEILATPSKTDRFR